MDGELLKAYGIDYPTGLRRCANDPAFYELLLSMFLKDDAFERAKAAYERRDYELLFGCAHELKGATGNAAMTELYEAASRLVELLRGENDDPARLEKLFDAMETAYWRAREGIALACGKP